MKPFVSVADPLRRCARRYARGFLIGTYGVEEALVSFAKAFARCPPSGFTEESLIDRDVKYRVLKEAAKRGSMWLTPMINRMFLHRNPKAAR
jgi:hypothetical protein